jgi:hypothetical protein
LVNLIPKGTNKRPECQAFSLIWTCPIFYIKPKPDGISSGAVIYPDKERGQGIPIDQ